MSWAILPNTHRGRELDVVMENARLCWQAGGSLVFHDNQGDKRCIVAACVFLRQLTRGPQTGPNNELWRLSILLEPRRTLAPILQELLARYHNGTHENFIPTSNPDFIITMVMQGWSSSWAMFKAYYPGASRDVHEADTFWDEAH